MNHLPLLLLLTSGAFGSFLTKRENANLQMSCGKDIVSKMDGQMRYGKTPWAVLTQLTDKYAGVVISPRHLLTWNVEVGYNWHSDTTGRPYSPEECRDRYMQLKPGRTFYASWWETDRNGQKVQKWTNTAPNNMFFIGQCDANARRQYPNGFILVEYRQDVFKQSACLPFHKRLSIGERVQGQSYNQNGHGNRIFDFNTVFCGRQNDNRHCVRKGFLTRQDRGSALIKNVGGQSTVFGVLGDVAYNSNPSADEYFNIAKHLDVVCFLTGICDPRMAGK